MRLYPLFADLRARPVLVVGGGRVAGRKVAALLAAGAQVSVGAPKLTTRITRWAASGRVRHLAGAFTAAWLDGQWLVVAASGDPHANRAVAQAAAAHHLLVNVVDDAALSSFHVPAVVDRAPLVLAISTGGAAPALARRVREKLEALLDESLGTLVALAARERESIKTRYHDMTARRQFFDWLWQGPVARLLRTGNTTLAEQTLHSALAPGATRPTSGAVTLVGAGPGDPGLLTLRAVRALQNADVILYDRLVSQKILSFARRDAHCISVGKGPGENHEATQTHIHALLLEHARAHRQVVRLKGGDPLVFGRGGEELEFLRAHDIAYEVVPGITAANGCAAYAGVPLTNREHAQSVHLVTAHCKDSLDTLDWRALAQPRQTLAVYMGVGQLEFMERNLVAQGCASDTPFALVENGTRPEQRVITGTLACLTTLARSHAVRSPALLILGEVAALAPRLAWFGTGISAPERLAAVGA